MPVQVTLDGQSDVPRDGVYKLTVLLTAGQTPVLATIGAGINEIIDDLRLADRRTAAGPGSRITTIVLEPGQTCRIDFEADVGDMRDRGGAGLCKDMNYVGAYVLANGRLALVTTAFWLVPEESA